MSSALISRSPDIRRLVEDGYEAEIRHNHLLVGHVPYLDSEGHVKFGTLVSPLELAGDRTAPPADHVVFFAGGIPHGPTGSPLNVLHGTERNERLPGVVVDCSFSAKPAEGYPDYHAKMTTYAHLLAGPARLVDVSATAQTFRVVESDPNESVFQFAETASGRAGISMITEKLKSHRVAIIGAGGTGSYLLDQLAKTPVREIHIFDGDVLLQHNVFRMPGAASIEELQGGRAKVDYLKAMYSAMHRGVIAHAENVTEENFGLLDDMDFVFLSLDDGPSRKLIVEHLDSAGVGFIDVGMGVTENGGELTGLLRVSTSTPQRPLLRGDDHRLPMAGAREDDVYDSNIQIAELNALNAMFAIVKWKKILGFYADLQGENQSAYDIDGNLVINDSLAQCLDEAA